MTDDELFADIPHPVDRPDADPAGQLEFDDEDAGPFGRGGRGPSPFAEGLNPDQLDAVVHENGPLLVVAGAGSGKTRVLTHRIAHLIHQGVPPSKILAITFTNKAAAEMRDRVGVLVGPVVRTMWVSTFHSACVRILRANGDVLGYPRQFSIYDQADTTRLTGYVIRDLGSRLEAVHAPWRARDHQQLEERAGRLRRWRRRGRRTSSTASTPTSTPSTSSGWRRRGRWTSTTC